MNIILRILGLDITPLRNIESASINLLWGWAGLVLLLLVMLPVTLYFYRFEGKSPALKQKWSILAIRTAWIFLLAFLMTGPVLNVSGLVPQRSRIAVMIDRSRSMSIQSQDKTRFEVIQDLFDNQNFIRRLENQTSIEPDVFTFDAHVSPVSKDEIANFSFKPDGNQTDISKAIQDVISNLGESNLLGIIMMTDGVSTIGENPMLAASNIRVPVHFVSPGGDGDVPDLSVQVNRPPSIGYLDSSLRIQGEVGAYRLATQSVRVDIFKDGEHYSTVEATFEDNRETAPFSFDIRCDEEGDFKYEVRVPELENELTYDNNSAAFLLRVIRESLKVVSISGTPGWDMKFIGSALASDDNITLKRWLKIGENRWLSATDLTPHGATNNPNFSEQIQTADILVLEGINYRFISSIEETIINRIETGAMGLLILPARKTFNELGYNDSKLAELFPVHIQQQTWRGNPGNMSLPHQDVSHNFLRLLDDPIENMEFFSTLPRFDGIYEFNRLKPGTEILLSSTVQGRDGNIPFMLTSRTGQGNVMMITGAPMWQMGFRLAPSAHGFTPYSGLIVNMFKWLADRREDAQVSIELVSSRGSTGQTAPFRVWVQNEQRQLLSNAQVRLNIKDPDGNTADLVCMESSETGRYDTSFVPVTDGLHKLEAIARFQGNELGRAKADFLVEIPTAEFDNPIVDFELMQRVASQTGGLAVEAKDINKLITFIEPKPGDVTETKIVDLRDSWILLVVLLALPLAEWFIRRTGGLS